MTKNKASPGRRLITYLIILSAAILVGPYLWPQAASFYQELAELRQQRNIIQQETERLNQLLAREDQTIDSLSLQHDEQDRLNIFIPCFSNLPQVIGNLEEKLNGYSGAINALKIGEAVENESHISLGINLIFSGSGQQARALLSSLEHFSSMLVIDNINWTASGGNNVRVSLDFRLIFFNDLTAGL